MATVSFSTVFNFSTKLISFTDTSTGVGSGNNGCFKIISPSGVTIYNNTTFTNAGCDIDLNQSVLTSQQTISFVPELGNYTILYTIADAATGLIVVGSSTQVYNNIYVSPVVAISQTVDCIGVVWGQTDVTNYQVSGFNPTSISIVNKLVYPAGANEGSPPSPVVTSTSNLSTSTFFNGTQTSEVTTTLQYVINGVTINDVVFGSKEFIVNCTYVCQIRCCVQNMAKKAQEYAQGDRNPILAQKYQQKFNNAMALAQLIDLAVKCGQGSNNQVNCYIQEIYDITECTEKCNCGSTNNTQVVGWGSIIGVNGTNGRDGTNGTNGTNGINGASILYNNTTVDTAYSGTLATLKSYTLPSNASISPSTLGLINAGDMIDVSATAEISGSLTFLMGLYINGTVLISFSTTANSINGAYFYAKITRITATTVFVEYGEKQIISTFVSKSTKYTEILTVNNLDSSTNAIAVQGSSTAPTTVVCTNLMVTLYKYE